MSKSILFKFLSVPVASLENPSNPRPISNRIGRYVRVEQILLLLLYTYVVDLVNWIGNDVLRCSNRSSRFRRVCHNWRLESIKSWKIWGSYRKKNLWQHVNSLARIEQLFLPLILSLAARMRFEESWLAMPNAMDNSIVNIVNCW